MLYLSTRGQADLASSAHVIKEGMAADGGLFVPQRFPGLRLDDILSLANIPYAQCAAKILGYYLTDYSQAELEACTSQAYPAARFGPDPVPLVKITNETDVLELWHGPTSAFKDIALQLLPLLLTLAMDKTGENTRSVILVATSGDTGKAALEGFANVKNTDILVFYPEDGVSPMQKLQMMTQAGDNVHVFGIKGNFDDAQSGVKHIFGDKELAQKLLDNGYAFSSANSINWGRLVPQIVYYFRAYAKAVGTNRIVPGEPVNISVPTGNFGDILAGYYAMKMGLPVRRFICASNSNNVLTDFISTGIYDKHREFHKTASPSMDILVSSNLERLLFDLTGNDAVKVAGWMKQLAEFGSYNIGAELGTKVRELFFGAWVDEVETSETIGRVFNDHKYLLDPHTAVAWRAAEKYRLLTSDETYTIVLSTASPYKFNKVVLDSLGQGSGIDDQHPFDAMRKLHQLSGLPIPEKLSALESKKLLHQDCIEPAAMTENVLKALDL